MIFLLENDIICQQHLMKNLCLALLAALIVGGTTQCCGDNMIKVSGNAEIKVKPDIAILTVEVEITDRTTSAALSGMNTQMAQVIGLLQDSGIASDDYSTSSFSIRPEYTYINDVRVLTGQTASQSLSVKIRDLTQDGVVIGQLVDDLSPIKGIRLNGVRFEQSDQSLGVRQARRAAFDSAKAKADQYGLLTGQRVGRILNIMDVDGGYYRPFFSDAEGFSARVETVVPVRDVTVSASVDMIFSLGI